MDGIKLLSLALLSLSPATAFLKNKEVHNVPTLVLSLEDAVKPGMIDEYIQTTKKWIERLKKKKVNTSFNTFLESNGIVNYLEPIFSMSEVNQRALNKDLESFHRTELGQRRQSTIHWSKYSVWTRSSHLSYKPVNPNPPPNNMLYFVWKHIQLRPGSENTFIDVATKFKEIFQKHSVGRGYSVFCNIIGYERPWYTVVFPGKDPGELSKWQQLMEQELGSELKPILDKLYDNTEQITEGSGWAIPELSLTNK